MKRAVMLAVALAVIAPLTASCESPPPLRIQGQSALLVDVNPACRAEVNAGAGALIGKPIKLADDAFVNAHTVVISTVGQSASGRMPPPTTLLRLLKIGEACRLQLAGVDRLVELPGCRCRAGETQ